MRKKSVRKEDIECPFYKYDDRMFRVTCEGIVDESSIMLHFHKQADFEKQMEVFCCKYYPKCEIYRMLMEFKYGED